MVGVVDDLKAKLFIELVKEVVELEKRVVKKEVMEEISEEEIPIGYSVEDIKKIGYSDLLGVIKKVELGILERKKIKKKKKVSAPLSEIIQEPSVEKVEERREALREIIKQIMPPSVPETIKDIKIKKIEKPEKISVEEAIGKYITGEVSLERAAELCGVSIDEIIKILTARGIDIHKLQREPETKTIAGKVLKLKKEEEIIAESKAPTSFDELESTIKEEEEKKEKKKKREEELKKELEEIFRI